MMREKLLLLEQIKKNANKVNARNTLWTETSSKQASNRNQLTDNINSIRDSERQKQFYEHLTQRAEANSIY